MPNITVTMSSAGTSRPANLAYLNGCPITVAVYASTTGTANFTVQYTLDDVQTVASPVWAALSSAIGAAGTVFNSTSLTTDGILFNLLTPVAAVRLNSSALSSNPLTMKLIQGESW